jgi:predicted RecA/RadA family phage recombinase
MADKQSEKPPLDKQPPEVLSPAAVLARSRASRTAPTPKAVTTREFRAPVGGVVEGRAYWIHGALAIADATVGTEARFHGLTGTVEYAKVHEQEWVAGDVVYWHATGGCLSVIDPGGHMRVGVADQDAPNPSATGVVRLDALPAGPGGGSGATVTSVAPATAVCGGPDLTLHVSGTGFTESSVILFNGGEEPTTYVSATELTTLVKPSLAVNPVVVPVSVVGAPTAVNFTFTPGAAR